MDERKSTGQVAQVKTKQYYTVKVEANTPVLLTYRVYAEDPEQAIELVQRNPLSNLSEAPKPLLARMRKLKATVYSAGNSLIQFTKKLGA